MNIAKLIQFYTSKRPIKIKDNKDLCVMSFNIRCISKLDKGNKYYKVRLPLIKKLLEEQNPDIIGFQEVKVKQFKYLIKVLNGYDYEYRKRDNKKNGEANPVFYKRNRFDCLNKDSFWLSETYKVMSNTFNGSCNRMCSYVHLLDKTSNKDLYVFNTHLDHKSDEARIKGVQLIKKIINQMNIKNIPHLIIGDMNDFYSTLPINELFNGYIDASKFNNKENGITFHNYGTEKQKIDYIAISDNVKQLDYKVITNKYNDIYPSDHYPIEVIIKL